MKLFPNGKNARGVKPLILVVDDDPNIRRVMVRVLRRKSFEVIETDRGANVLALCLEHRPRLVFLDLIMPGIDGAQVVKILQSTLSSPIPSIVMVTGTHLSLNVKEALGIDDFLPKPFELDRVISLARKYSSPSVSASSA